MNCVVGPVSIALPCHFGGADQSSTPSNYHVEQKKALEHSEKKTVQKKRKKGKRRHRRRRAKGKTHASMESRSDIHSKQPPVQYNNSRQVESHGNHTTLFPPQQNICHMYRNVSVGAAPQNTQYTQYVSNVPTAAQYIQQPAFGSHGPAISSSHMTENISQSHQLLSHGIHAATQAPLAPQPNTCLMNNTISVAAAPQCMQYNNNAPTVAQYIHQQSVGSLNPAPSSSQDRGQDTTFQHSPQQPPYVSDGPSVLPMEGEELSFQSSHPMQYIHQRPSGSTSISSNQETRKKAQHSPQQPYISDGPSVLPMEGEELSFQSSHPVQYIHQQSSGSPPISSNQETREKATSQHSPQQAYVCDGPSVLPMDDEKLFYQSSDPAQYRHVDGKSKYVDSSQLTSADQPPQLSPVSCHRSHPTLVKSEENIPACSPFLMNAEPNSRLVSSSDVDTPARSPSLMSTETKAMLIMRLTRTLLIEKMKVPEVTMPHIDAHPDCYDPASPGYEASINNTKCVEYDPSKSQYHPRVA